MLNDKQVNFLLDLWKTRIAYLRDGYTCTAEEQARMCGHANCYEQVIMDLSNVLLEEEL